jgi:hypothetical protein
LPREVWEVLAAAAIVAWRIRGHPLAALWHDWLTILCLFWVASLLGSRTRAWPYFRGGVMTGLLVLYTVRQLPLTLGVLGALR